MTKSIILASGSPRRKELLMQIGIEPIVLKSTVEEVITDTDPVKIVESLSAQKCRDVAEKLLKKLSHPSECCCDNLPEKAYEEFQGFLSEATPVLGADTIVVLDGKILGKPQDEEDAYRMLKSLSGRSHQVYTGVTIIRCVDGSLVQDTFSVETLVFVEPLTDDEIHAYIASRDPMDKAGAYGIQGIFGKHISGIQGDYYNVVGLPIAEVYKHLR